LSFLKLRGLQVKKVLERRYRHCINRDRTKLFTRRDRSTASFHTNLPYVAADKGGFPTGPARGWPHHIIPLAKTSTGFERDFSSAISGFRSLCGRKQRSFPKPSRSKGPAFWNLSLGAGSRF